MDPIILAVVSTGTAAFVGLWRYRLRELRNAHAQRHLVHLFVRQVRAFRRLDGIPQSVADFVEGMADMPFSGAMIVVGMKRILGLSGPLDGVEHRRSFRALTADLQSMRADTRENLISIIVTFMLAQSYSSVLLGGIYRRLYLQGRSRSTQADFALETIVGRWPVNAT